VTPTDQQTAFWQLRGEILSAISSEKNLSSQAIIFAVKEQAPESGLWRIEVEPTSQTKGGLDDTLEGATAWWPGPPRGAADVLSVIPEEQRLYLRFATGRPPSARERLWIYPPQYLEALLLRWSDVTWAERCLAWWRTLGSANRHDPHHILPSGPWTGRLRASQAEAFRLTGYDTAFLWGPPGTGKTFTLGALLAQHLLHFRDCKVLLLSTTNSAVDQALVSVDRSLEEIGRRCPDAGLIRKRCLRIGTHFVASHYKGRDHLLPTHDRRLTQRLINLDPE
jgi:hypothetical protein